ncbi:flavin monoamine oxidase family protein [Undibacter mobilis]|uniref:Tryptophan 2-monooxygenase n=1 Tax=Undibacter mobilis TaxID=2292256 RepID=A0A371B3T5_9BRAD|nr:NAD(P)/FAD-dependent oxidoreductase [Undibacter mobilis]RDV02182.1 FAD-dependent oxidoreductase [Undibacter mobilis]
MSSNSVEVAVIGGGAAGIAAARKLTKHGIDCLIVEARDRLGGRAYTLLSHPAGHALDMGCGWLHSADRNPWTAIATAQGRAFNKAPPPWDRPMMTHVVPLAVQEDYARAMNALFGRMAEAANAGHDAAASEFLEPGNKWNGTLNAVATFISGVELEHMSAVDFDRYGESDSEVDWRLFDGYGTLIASHGHGIPVALDCEVTRIDHRGKRLRIETKKGVIEADQAIVTLPTSILGERADLFLPALPDKTAIARRLPLGLDDKLFLALEGAEEFGSDSRVLGRLDTSATASYQFRPFDRPMIEAYFGGACARELEAGGEAAFFDFAVTELTGLFGSAFARRLKPIGIHLWGADPFAGGAYSYAVPGAADQRAALAAPVDNRLFFAGEACSRFDFSTAHGAYVTGHEAAERILAARRKS